METIFDPELYRRTQEETRHLLQNKIAPPGPQPVAEKRGPASPVTINVGAGGGWETIAGKPTGTFWETIAGGEPPPIVPRSGGFVAPPHTGPAPWRGRPIPDRMSWEDYSTPMSFGPVARDQALRSPWTTENLGGGRKRYVLEGDQGWLEAGPGAPGGTIRDTFPVIPSRDIGTYQSGTKKVNIFGKEVEVPIFTTGVEGAPNTGTRGEWASMGNRGVEQPQWTIPENVQKQMDHLMKVITSPDAYAAQRHAAANALGSLERMVAEQNRQARGAYEFGQRMPLFEREAAAREAGIPIQQQQADTQRFVAEQTVKYQDQMSKHITAGPGTTVIDRETGKPVFKGAFAPERTAGLMNYALSAATEEGLTGKTVNPLTFIGVMNMMGSRLGEDYKPITIKEVPKEWISPHIENRIKRIKPGLKTDSDEYRKLYEVYEKALYMTGQ